MQTFYTVTRPIRWLGRKFSQFFSWVGRTIIGALPVVTAIAVGAALIIGIVTFRSQGSQFSDIGEQIIDTQDVSLQNQEELQRQNDRLASQNQQIQRTNRDLEEQNRQLSAAVDVIEQGMICLARLELFTDAEVEPLTLADVFELCGFDPSEAPPG